MDVANSIGQAAGPITPTLMIQGTNSSAGKSALVTGICRFYAREGLRVAPFKSQNMALNAYVCADGLEIGRAQAVQAMAAGCDIEVDMNPILLKPTGQARSQVVVMGRPLGHLSAGHYHREKPELRMLVEASLARLRSRYDMVVIEGAGSPAEINLREHELVNMFVAHAAEAPTLLVGDIDRGGVFAAFAGTLLLLGEPDRRRIVGCVVNRFRGDLELLKPGLQQIEDITGVPVMGVVPYLSQLEIPEEDSLGLAHRATQLGAPTSDKLQVLVLRSPWMSNYDDFASLEAEPHVELAYGERPEDIAAADLVVLPGSKATMSDLQWLRRRGLDRALIERAQRSGPILGICGGCQILGRKLHDPHGHEHEGGDANVPGLGLLDIDTEFLAEKTTRRVWARPTAHNPFVALAAKAAPVPAYEIHCGEVSRGSTTTAAFTIEDGQGRTFSDGAYQAHVQGTMLHGILDDDGIRDGLLRRLSSLRGRSEIAVSGTALASRREASFDRLADAAEAALGRDTLLAWAEGQGPRTARRTFGGRTYDSSP